MVRSTINLDALSCFHVFSDKLNFTHAAEQLHISQPALYMKIQELSESLGVPLYRKIGRRLELTEQGRLVARFSRDLSERTASFLKQLETGTDSRPVALAAGEGAYLYLLGAPIREFLRKNNHPLQLLTLNQEGVIDAIKAGKAHIGVASLESTPPGFEAKLLHKADQVVVFPKSHPLSAKNNLKLQDLRGCKLIVPPPDRPHRQMLSMALQSASVDWEVAVETNGWELMLHFVKLGIGIAIVNSICTIPKGLVARKLPELPRVHYHVFNLIGAADRGPQAELRAMLLSRA